MVFVSLLAGSIVDKVGHARLMSFGALLMALSIAAFSSAIYLDSNLAIILLAIILRILQGAAAALINTAAYSFAAQGYTDQVEKVISIMESVVGVGCAAGPVLGSVVYEFLGFAWTFLLFGILMAPTSALLCFLGEPLKIKARREAV
mmetsp:Transcript_41108/g.53941  ORF Transcript_41108/g.53941 Transcript_41108/m.53941 type:complete len:147 (+) Transcript_41108:227-667(+)